MNIFVMFLVFLFMAGYYFLDSPGSRNIKAETEYALSRAELRGIAECAATAHTATLREYEFADSCLEKYEIAANTVCLNEKYAIMKCEITGKKKPAFSFIITKTPAMETTESGEMLEILEQYYPDASGFGILDDGIILSGSGDKRAVPAAIIKSEKLENGQLVYMTQYEIPDLEKEFTATAAPDVKCGKGSVKVFRFSRWQCVAQNTKSSCAGDMRWDADIGECVADNSRRPLCAPNQTAVMVDDTWQCVDPFLERTCEKGMTARLNYDYLEWECVPDMATLKKQSKCTPQNGAIYGMGGATLRVPTTSCTDCEEMQTDPDTCASICVPSSAKLSDPKCYPNARECSGTGRAFYFGFPSAVYASRVPDIANMAVPLDATHSQNRKFNCLDCAGGRIDSTKSLYPFVAVCE